MYYLRVVLSIYLLVKGKTNKKKDIIIHLEDLFSWSNIVELINDLNKEHVWSFICCYVRVCIFSWVFMHEKAHQLRDTGIESAVMTKVKGLGKFNNHVMDVADYVVPSQVSKCPF